MWLFILSDAIRLLQKGLFLRFTFRLLCIIAFYFIVNSLNNGAFAQTPLNPSTLISNMLLSMDHIQTIESDVTVEKQTDSGVTTLNYHLITKDENHIVAQFEDRQNGVYVLNNRGYYIVLKGEPEKQKYIESFPFSNPVAFLSRLDMKDVTLNYRFELEQELEHSVVVIMIPVGTAGGSIESAMGDRVTKLEFTIKKEPIMLQKVRVFKNFNDTPEDTISIRYEWLTPPAFTGQARQIMMNYVKSEVSYTNYGEPTTEIKQTWYKNTKINHLLDEDVFDEEEY